MAAHSEYRSIIEGLQRWEIAPNDPSYPPALLDLGHEAPVLHGYGDPSVLSGECISIVGARKATPYGRTCAKMAGRAAAECGITVVSGGAIGCDQCAGTAALDAGGKTVVIPGCGADCVYPSSSDELFARAVRGGGCVVSLEHWGAPPGSLHIREEEQGHSSAFHGPRGLRGRKALGNVSHRHDGGGAWAKGLCRSRFDLLGKLSGNELAHRVRRVHRD